MLRIIREFKPRWVIGENVAGIINMALGQVLTDLENEGFEVKTFVIPACAVNAPHRRDRVWIVGYSTGKGLEGSNRPQLNGCTKDVENPISKRGRGRSQSTGQILDSQSPEAKNQGSSWQDWTLDWREVAFATCHDRVDDGLPKRMVRLPDGDITQSRWRIEALKAYGNSIVPQVAIEIMKGIKSVELLTK